MKASTADTIDHIPETRINEFPSIVLNPSLQMWIWEDNMNFLHQKNIFQHAYFTLVILLYIIYVSNFFVLISCRIISIFLDL